MNATSQEYIEVKHNITSDKGWFHVILNFYDKNHKRKQVWRSLKLKDIPGNRNLAKRKALEIARQFEEDLNTPKETVTSKGSDILFGNYIKEWLETVKSSIEVTTYASYKNKIKTISEYFNNLDIKLIDLKKSDIKAFYQHLLKDKKLKPQSIRRYHANISKSLKDAMELDLISSNPASNIKIPKAEQFIGAYYNQSELENLFKIAKDSSIGLHILLASYYGLRRSETCAIKWSAIDFVNKSITISHTVTQCNVDGKYKLVKKNKTKNNSSYRSLPLVPRIEELLLIEKQKQEYNKKLFGNSYKNKEGYILVDDEGKLILPDRVTKLFRELLKENNLRKIRFHDLRHSCASLLLANGINMKEIQQWLGHSNFSTTANIYSHLDSNSKQNSANVIANVFCKSA